MKLKKILLWLVVAVVLVAIIAVLAVAFTLDSIVKRGVETYGPQIIKVSVKLDAVHIGVLSGSARIKGLVVGNPEGYTSSNSITAGLISVGIDSGSLLKDKIVVKSVRLESPEITFEGGLMKNNLMQIKSDMGGTNTPAGPPPASTGPGKKLEVDDFWITGAKVHVIAAGTTVTIPEIHLTNLGTGPDGITAANLSKKVLDELITSALKEVINSSLVKGGGKTANEAVGKATKSLGDLFKKKE